MGSLRPRQDPASGDRDGREFSGDFAPRVIRVGVGRAARIDAAARAEQLRADGIAARALFKPEWGGWVVFVVGRIRADEPVAPRKRRRR
jgi:hypothetical protein